MSFCVKIEVCQKCGCTSTENLVRIESAKPVMVYVRCTKCGAFVARYTLERYTSEKPYESLLRFLRNHGHSISSRSRAQEVDGFSTEVEREYESTLNSPPCKAEIEEIIWERGNIPSED